MTEYMRIPPAGQERTIEIERSPSEGGPRVAHVLDRRSALAVNAALAAARPLLVRGEPGLGKSQLARAVAADLGWRFETFVIDSQTEPRDLLYTEDLVQRLADAQIQRNASERLDRVRYVLPGPLWRLFNAEAAREQLSNSCAAGAADGSLASSAAGAVLLVDEIDKAESSVPNALLEALGQRRFATPTGEVSMVAGRQCLVVLTTNEERALPDAFLRRCLVLHMSLPEGRSQVVEELMRRGRVRYPEVEGVDVVMECAAGIVADARRELAGSGLSLPGVAEFIDLVDAAVAQRQGVEFLREIGEYVIFKHGAPPRGGDGSRVSGDE
jgi:MoxR-like ATPase